LDGRPPREKDGRDRHIRQRQAHRYGSRCRASEGCPGCAGRQKAGPCQNAPLIKGIPGTALFASRGIDVPEDYRKTTRCPIVHSCRAASAVWTDEGGKITGKYEFTTVSEETAKGFKAIVEGFKAIGELRYSNIPAVKKVMNGLKVETQGATFTATFTTSTGDIEAAFKAAMDKRKASPQGKKCHDKKKCPADKK